MSTIENIRLIGIGPRNHENMINDHKSQISILGKLSASDVIFFLSWCSAVSSEHCFKVSLKSEAFSIDQSSLGPFGSGN